MRDLDFFVIGAQKCATSWLYYCLREHPHLHLPEKKDEAAYFGGPRFQALGEDWFDSLFVPKPGARARGSASVDYLHDSRALREVTHRFPAARLVVCLRDPLQRTASAAEFLKRRSLLPMESLSKLVEGGLKDHAAGRKTLAAELITRSLYGSQLEGAAAATERLLVLSFDAVRDRPLDAVRTVYGFLGVDEKFMPVALGSRVKRNANIDWLVRMERLAPGSRVLAKVMDHANRWLSRTWLARPYAPYEASLLRRYRTVLKEDARRLSMQLARLPESRKFGGRELETLWGLLA